MTDRFTPEDAIARLAAGDRRYVSVLTNGNVEVEFYAPRESDPQQAHTRDEYYFVISGNGQFVQNGRRQPVVSGDFLYVPAGKAHRFEDFSDDFATWAVFVPVEGSEA